MKQETVHTFSLRDLMSSGLQKIGRMGAGVFGGMDRRMQALENRAGSLGEKLGGLAASIGLYEIGRQVIETTANFEKMEAVLTNTLGSQSAAQKAMADIQAFAARTPFQVDGLTDSFVKLANRGFVPTMAEMTRLGDIASSTGKDMDMLVEALLDAQTGEFERLKEFGVRASKSGDQVTFAFKGQEQQVAFTETAIRDYILSLGDMQGVSGGMAAISGTLAGQLSNAQDRMTNLWKTIGENLRPQIGALVGAFGSMLDGLTSAVEWLGKNREVSMALAAGLGTVAAALGVVQIATMAWNAVLAANPISLVILSIGALVGALVYAWNQFASFRGAMYGLWAAVKKVFENIASIATDIFGGLGQAIQGMLNLDPKAIAQGLSRFGLGISAANPAGIISRASSGVGEAYRKAFDMGVDDFREDQKQGVGTGNVAMIGADKFFQGKKAQDPAAAPGAEAMLGSSAAAAKAATAPKVNTMAQGNRAMRNFTINIERITGIETVNTTNIQEGIQNADRLLTEAIMRILRDTQQIA